MRIAVVGTGAVGRALSAGFADLGHDVVVGTRDPEVTRAREEWRDATALLPLEEVAAGADLVVNATNGRASLEALQRVGAETLEGVVLLDVANPLDFSAGFPPSLTVHNTDSLAETLQRALPGARVVKSLNTVNAELMLHPETLAEPTTMFVASDDPEARATVIRLLQDAGWVDLVEFDTLSAARGMEMWLPLWVRLMGQLGTARFNLRIVR